MSNDLYRVLSEPTPKAERDAVILAEWRKHQAEQAKRILARVAIVLASVIFVLVTGFWLAWLAY